MACVVGNLSALNKKIFCFYVHFIHFVRSALYLWVIEAVNIGVNLVNIEMCDV